MSILFFSKLLVESSPTCNTGGGTKSILDLEVELEFFLDEDNSDDFFEFLDGEEKALSKVENEKYLTCLLFNPFNDFARFR